MTRNDTTTDGIERSRVREKLREADAELDSAVEHWSKAQAMYWLGRKEVLKGLLDEGSGDTDQSDPAHPERDL